MKYVLLLLCSLACYCAHTQPEWDLKIDRDGIKVYNLKNDTAKINELKVETDLRANSSKLLKVITDVNNHTQWVYGTKSCYLLKKISDTDFFFYKEVKSPSPLYNRDIIAHMLVKESGNTTVKIQVVAAPRYLPEKKGLVRVPYFNEIWTITAINDKQTRIEYHLKIDPGGRVPSLLVNLFATKGPYESFLSLKKMVEDKSAD